MNTTKNQIKALQMKEAQSEKFANIVSGLIIGLLTIGGLVYCCKGAYMQIVANWTLTF